jgi:hypothetical protein
MAGNKTKKSKEHKARYESYKQSSRLVKNAVKKLERHIKKFPNDMAAQQALREVTSKKYKKSPENKVGWITKQPAIKADFENVQNPQTTITKQRAVLAAQVISFTKKAPRLPMPTFAVNPETKANEVVFKFEKYNKVVPTPAVEEAKMPKRKPKPMPK